MKKLVSLFIAIVMMSCVVLTVPVSAGYIGNCPYPSCQKPADLCICVGCSCRSPNNLAEREITNEQLAEMIADGTIRIIYTSETVALYRYLSLSDNLISDISPLAELTNLGNLSLNKNQIADISPLASLTGLEWLGLSDNAITDISSLAGLTNLRGLGLRNNLIDDISPLNQLQKLESLNVQGNPNITLKQVEELSESLPNCEIHSDFGIYSDFGTYPKIPDNTCTSCKICKSGKPPVKGVFAATMNPTSLTLLRFCNTLSVWITRLKNATTHFLRHCSLKNQKRPANRLYSMLLRY